MRQFNHIVKHQVSDGHTDTDIAAHIIYNKFGGHETGSIQIWLIEGQVIEVLLYFAYSQGQKNAFSLHDNRQVLLSPQMLILCYFFCYF